MLVRVQYLRTLEPRSCSLHVPFSTAEPETMHDNGHRETSDLCRSYLWRGSGEPGLWGADRMRGGCRGAYPGAESPKTPRCRLRRREKLPQGRSSGLEFLRPNPDRIRGNTARHADMVSARREVPEILMTLIAWHAVGSNGSAGSRGLPESSAAAIWYDQKVHWKPTWCRDSGRF